MSENKQKQPKSTSKKSRAAEIANTFEWLIIAFVLAFLVRGFVIEAYRIPTGSMADTFMGAHLRTQCPQCGYKYEFGFTPTHYGMRENAVPGGTLPPVIASRITSRCPSCGSRNKAKSTDWISYGDRILVIKSLYLFFEPNRWDVIVFKNPSEPKINLIKRLIGRPGEEVEIIDGDVYINGQITRKPPKIQDELWMTVYDNDYHPVRPNQSSFNGHFWKLPFDMTGSNWKADTKTFTLNSLPGSINIMSYDTKLGNDFRATYAYNELRYHKSAPICSDLKINFFATSENLAGVVGAKVSKYGTVYTGKINYAGKMTIAKSMAGAEEVLAQKQIYLDCIGRAVEFSFTNVDHQLILNFGKDKLVHDLGRLPDDAGQRKFLTEPEAKIFGSGKLTLSHVAIYKDIHYLGTKPGNGGPTRASENNSFKLGKDEFFALGDNSPISSDSRWWNQEGIGNNGKTYRPGVVPRDFLVGKAAFVYWSQGFKPFDDFRIAFIPNIAKMRLIYSGSEQYN